MTFPTPFTVQHHRAEVITEDDLGNNEVIFSAPTAVAVIEIAPLTAEQLGEYATRQITDVDLYVLPGFNPGLRDRFTLPGSAGLYEVIGTADWTQGFHQWAPGRVIQLRKVEG